MRAHSRRLIWADGWLSRFRSRRTWKYSSRPSVALECARPINRHCSGKRHYSAHLPHWLILYVPSDFTGIISGTGSIEVPKGLNKEGGAQERRTGSSTSLRRSRSKTKRELVALIRIRIFVRTVLIRSALFCCRFLLPAVEKKSAMFVLVGHTLNTKNDVRIGVFHTSGRSCNRSDRSFPLHDENLHRYLKPDPVLGANQA